jgi:fatty-acyl-CoA synthase
MGTVTSESELMAWCRQRLAAYKSPRRIWILKEGELPQNSNGKVLRRVLRERFSQGFDCTAS